MIKTIISTYKIGLQYYKDKLDKNSGTYEYFEFVNELKNQISKSLIINKNIEESIFENQDILIIFGGLFYEEEKEKLDELISNSKKVIFIATDIDSDSCNEIIQRCSLLLTQSKRFIPWLHCENQAYSYMPEFFSHVVSNFIKLYNIDIYSDKKYDEIIFGGSLEGRVEKIRSFLFNDIELQVKIIGKIYERDERLEYYDYLKELVKYKYSFVTIHGKALKNGWVSSRYIESICLNVIPLVDRAYDIDNIFKINVKVDTAYQIRTMIGNKAIENFLYDDMRIQRAKVANNRFKVFDFIEIERSKIE